MLKKWGNSSEIPLFRKRTKWIWSWVNYVWLHLQSSQKRVKTLLWLCGYWIPKNFSHGVTSWWLSLYPRPLQSKLGKCRIFPVIVVPNTVAYRFWKELVCVKWHSVLEVHRKSGKPGWLPPITRNGRQTMQQPLSHFSPYPSWLIICPNCIKYWF